MRYLAVTALLAILASCLTESDEQRRAELETSSFTQELSVCATTCPGGAVVSCASNYGCYSDSAGAYCWQGSYWQMELCGDPVVYCGNGTCDWNETPSSCLADCGYCGDGICSSTEDRWSCWSDCESCGPYEICNEP